MATIDRHRIFISYARADGADLAQRLKRELTEAGFDAWLDTQRLKVGATWTRKIEEAIDDATVLLALLSPGSYRSEICRAEQLRALRKDKLVIPLLAKPGADRPLHLETKNYLDFTGTQPFMEALRKLIADIDAGRGGVELKTKYRRTYVTTPPLPRNYIARPEAVEALRVRLLTDTGGPGIALTAVKGMGGIGKTVLAQALCHDEAVQEAFPDGIVWVAAGRESCDAITRMRGVCRVLGDELGPNEAADTCKNRYWTLIRDMAALIVVDDVWNVQDIEALLADSPRSRILFTTRDGSIAGAVGADEHLADLLSPEQSREVLAKWSGREVSSLPVEATDLVRECGRLPLALAVTGAMLRNKLPAYWGHVLDLLRSAAPHKDLMQSIHVSVSALDETTRTRYLALAVTLEDTAIPPAIQQTLWNTPKPLVTAEYLVERSLAQHEGEDGAIRLHDLQLDYVRAQHSNQEALKLIVGAVLLSSRAIGRDPHQFASQLTGRLLSHRMDATIQGFLAAINAGAPKPWLRPIYPTLAPPGAPLLLTLEGHSADVADVAVTRDGRAVSVSHDRTIRIWDLANGRALLTLECSGYRLNSVAVARDGLQAASASGDELQIWDVSAGCLLRTLKCPAAVYGVAMTPDGTRLVSASNDHTLTVWDVPSGRALRTLAGHSGPVTAVAAMPDGLRAVSASLDTTLKVWDLASGCVLMTLVGHSSCVYKVAVTPDGSRAVSASADTTLKVWDLATGRALSTLRGHSGSVDGVAITPDGLHAISASDDATMKVWDLATCRAQTLEGHLSRVRGVAVTPDGLRVVSASSDQTLKVWDLFGGRGMQRPREHLGAIRAVAVTSDGSRAISASGETLTIWDLATGNTLRTLKGHSDRVVSVALTPDGSRAISASWDKTLTVWDLATGRALRTLVGHSRHVNGVAVTPDGKLAISASDNESLTVWDLATGRVLRMLDGHSGPVVDVAVTTDGLRAVSSSWDAKMRVWDVASGNTLQILRDTANQILRLALTPDGMRAVSASREGKLEVWDLASGRPLQILKGHSSSINGVAVMPDGARAVSASDDKTLKIWDLASGQCLATFFCEASARCCTFVNNQHIVAGDDAGRLHLLAIESPTASEPMVTDVKIGGKLTAKRILRSLASFWR